MPAHITILYPFKDPCRIDDAVLAELASYFESRDSFVFTLSEIARFPGVLYLAPDDDSPFVELTGGLAGLYPELPPYGGAYAEVKPHLTVAHADEDSVLERITADLKVVVEGRLPIESRLTEVWLVEERKGRWEKRVAFQLGKE